MFNHRQNFLEFYKPLFSILKILILLHKKFDENKIKIKKIFNFVGVVIIKYMNRKDFSLFFLSQDTHEMILYSYYYLEIN